MASLGELTAGIAHEIQNPLNFVNNFSELSVELLDELKGELLRKVPEGDKPHVDESFTHIAQNLDKITYHGKRADSIVKAMLQHSRNSSGEKQPTDISALADEYLRLSYHGFRAKDKSFNATMKTHFDEHLGKVEVIPQDIGRVFLNLFNNAFYAVHQKKKMLNGTFEPMVQVSIEKKNNKIKISVKDNGVGIPEEVLSKIFHPFFTTKPAGEGTGLGLSLSYDIITKVHGGEMKLNTKKEEGAEFIILLPA
jgi:signal transduction histidine kinase